MINIAFVCAWDKNREKTWSGTPISLFNSLKMINEVNLIDIDVQLTPIENKFISICQFFNRNKKKFNIIGIKLMQRKFKKQLKQIECDAIIEIGDIGIEENINFYTYQDLCIFSLIEEYKKNNNVYSKYSNFGQFTLKDLMKRNKWQTNFYMKCKGVFAMSEWLKTTLQENFDFLEGKVYTVNAGINVPVEIDPPTKGENCKYILFVGRDFNRKNGNNVFTAFKKLRQENSNLRLIIAGPKEYPLEEVDENITFLGDADYNTLNQYYQLADVFCMPSYFEAFGIVFSEALVRGIPCIGLNRYAMPEIIKDYGVLVEKGTSDEIAVAITEVLQNGKYKKNIERDKEIIQIKYNWDNVAKKIYNQIKCDLNVNNKK